MAIDLRTAIEDRIGRDLGVYVGELRADGMGWRKISQHIIEHTDIYVSYEQLRLWFREDSSEVAS